MEKKPVELGKIFTTIAFMLVLVTCASFNMYTLFILIAMFAVAFIKKENQTSLVSLLESIYLVLVFGAIRLVVSFFRSAIGQIIIWADGNTLGAFADIFGIISFLVAVALALIALMALINSLSGKPTQTPAVSALAAKSFGIFVPKPVYYPSYPQQAPATPQQAPAAPQQAQTAPQPAAPAAWTCACGHVNTGSFCAACGKPKAM